HAAQALAINVFHPDDDISIRNPAWGRAFRAEKRGQCELLRSIYGPNPWEPLPTLPPSVLEWNDGLVRSLAEAAYTERALPSGHLDPARLGVLADALEESGVEDATLLAHLREAKPRTRGFWALDVVLGKE